ncbi:MAG: Bax inhibitor-1/YccA family protein [Fimbriiglobus sp.]|jgi:uncharacterized YccA/Bax inhibitor family protein|nr:Bax inhibitor-1/YccA family protein [Fimbriiglobus sp.]
MALKTSNPALSDHVFEQESRYALPSDTAMTLRGTVAKTGALVGILVAVALVSGWQTWQFLDKPSERPMWIVVALVASLIAALVIALVTSAKPRWSAVTAPLYAACEGWAIGGISTFFEAEYAGIVVQAAALTVGALVALLVVYLTGFIRPTENFKLMIAAATGGLAIVYGITALLALFGIRVPYLFDAGPIGIVFSLIAVAVAAFNLVLHFDFIENGVKRGAPKYMEWYAGFGLLVTLVWLYIEILKLLAKLRQRGRSSS